jgi:hypothetical protein
MRKELELIETIEKYLRNQLSETERSDFEQRIANDSDLQYEIKLQQEIQAGLERRILKISAARAHRTYRRRLRWTRGGFTLLGVAVILIGVFNFAGFKHDKINQALKSLDLQTCKAQIEIQKPFINPPLRHINVPFEEFSFSAEKGDTLYPKSGAILLFPANSLLDKNGNPVKGTVKVKYREFSKPMDFFLSGIPMSYDSAGRQYQFRSSGMCEINAFKDSEPVFVNPEHKPEMNMATDNSDPAHNLYFLDTIQKKWLNKGKDFISDLKKSTLGMKSRQKIELIKPVLADGERPTFTIEVLPGSIPELQAYNNLKFEIDKEEKNYNPKEAEVEWTHVKLSKGNQWGTYFVTFSTDKRSVSYLTRPVFEGKDFNAAVRIFEQKNKEFEAAHGNRIGEEEQTKKYNTLMTALEHKKQEENERISKLNILIEAKMRRIEEINKAMSEKNAETEKLNATKLAEFEKKRATQYAWNKKNQEAIEKMNANQKKKDDIIRSFSLLSFGIWNCDKPELWAAKPINARYVDETGKTLDLGQVYMTYSNIRGLCSCSGSRISYLPGAKNMIWSSTEDKFLYISYDDFNKAILLPEGNTFTFKMKSYPEKSLSLDDIRKLIDM